MNQKKTTILVLVFAAIIGLSRAALLEAQELNAIRVPDIKTDGVSVPVPGTPVDTSLAKPALPGPAKGACTAVKGLTPGKGSGLTKALEAPKGFIDLKLGLADKGGPMDCYNATPSTLSSELSTRLCEGAFDTAPVACYNATPSTLDAPSSVELCRGAVNNAPVDCYNATPSTLNAELSVKLCRWARNNAPVDCYNATPNSLPADLSAGLCSGAVNNGPIDCYNATPNSLPMNLSAQLCAHARDTAPVACYNATPNSMNMQDSVNLCMFHYQDNWSNR